MLSASSSDRVGKNLKKRLSIHLLNEDEYGQGKLFHGASPSFQHTGLNIILSTQDLNTFLMWDKYPEVFLAHSQRWFIYIHTWIYGQWFVDITWQVLASFVSSRFAENHLKVTRSLLKASEHHQWEDEFYSSVGYDWRQPRQMCTQVTQWGLIHPLFPRNHSSSNCGAGETAQWLKHLPRKHGYQSSDLQGPHNCQVDVTACR